MSHHQRTVDFRPKTPPFLRTIAMMGILSDKCQEDWKSILRREKGLLVTNFKSGPPARSGEVRKNSLYSGQGRGTTYGETGLWFRVITTIRETFNWVCCNLNEEGGWRGGGNVK